MATSIAQHIREWVKLVVFVGGCMTAIAFAGLALIVVVGFIFLLAVRPNFLSVEPYILIHYKNNTDSLVCLYYGTVASPYTLEPGTYGLPTLAPDEHRACGTPVKPREETSWASECPSGLDVSSANVVLVVELTGEAIYGRTEICQEWLDAGTTVTIDQDGGEFVVTDQLAD